MAKEFQAVLEREAALVWGRMRSPYDALPTTKVRGNSVMRSLKKIAIEITEKLRSSTTVDWQVRESVQARLHILVSAACRNGSGIT